MTTTTSTSTSTSTSTRRGFLGTLLAGSAAAIATPAATAFARHADGRTVGERRDRDARPAMPRVLQLSIALMMLAIDDLEEALHVLKYPSPVPIFDPEYGETRMTSKEHDQRIEINELLVGLRFFTGAIAASYAAQPAAETQAVVKAMRAVQPVWMPDCRPRATSTVANRQRRNWPVYRASMKIETACTWLEYFTGPLDFGDAPAVESAQTCLQPLGQLLESSILFSEYDGGDFMEFIADDLGVALVNDDDE